MATCDTHRNLRDIPPLPPTALPTAPPLAFSSLANPRSQSWVIPVGWRFNSALFFFYFFIRQRSNESVDALRRVGSFRVKPAASSFPRTIDEDVNNINMHYTFYRALPSRWFNRYHRIKSAIGIGCMHVCTLCMHVYMYVCMYLAYFFFPSPDDPNVVTNCMYVTARLRECAVV